MFPKERDKYNISLMNRNSLILPRTQHKVVLLVVLTMFAVGISSFLFLFFAPPTFRVPFTFASSPLSEILEQATCGRRRISSRRRFLHPKSNVTLLFGWREATTGNTVSAGYLACARLSDSLVGTY